MPEAGAGPVDPTPDRSPGADAPGPPASAGFPGANPPAPPLQVRLARPADRDDLYDVCVRTGDSGHDARGRYGSDELLGDVYAGPYLALEPELAFVVDDGARVVGYVVGAADTARFAARFRDEWLPRVGPRYEGPASLIAAPSPGDAGLLDTLRHPERMVLPDAAVLAAHPAHLHIDLLPAAQGQGLGRVLIRTFLGALRERDVPGMHLVVGAANTAAQAFYLRLGLSELPVPIPGAIALGAPSDLVV